MRVRGSTLLVVLTLSTRAALAQPGAPPGMGADPPGIVNGELKIAVGQTVTIFATGDAQAIYNVRNNMQWNVSDPTVATLEGTANPTVLLTGRRDGNVTVSYALPAPGASLRVTVGVGGPVTGTPMLIGGAATMATPAQGREKVVGPAARGAVIGRRGAAAVENPSMQVSAGARPAAVSAGARTLEGAKVMEPSTPSTPRQAVSGFTGSYISDGRIAFSWQPVPGAAGYLVFANVNGQHQVVFHTESPNAVTINDYFARGTAMISTPFPIGTHSFTVEAWYLNPGETAPDAQGNNGTRSGLPSNTVMVTVPRRSNQYRVTLNGFLVHRETFDNPAEIDGKRDEVYFKSAAQEFDTAGKPVGPEFLVKSFTYGDVNYADWQNPNHPAFRQPAGSASNLGGLMTGDGYPTKATPWQANGAPNSQRLPLLLWQGTLSEGLNGVMIAPTIWENDGKPDPFAPEREFVRSVGEAAMKYAKTRAGPGTGFEKQRLLVQAPVRVANKIAEDMLKKGTLFGGPALQVAQAAVPVIQAKIASFQSVLEQNLQLALNLKDRPIGLQTKPGGGYTFEPTTLTLDFELAEGLVNSGGLTGKGPGIVEVRYTDQAGNGDYTLYLQVTRLP